MIRSHLPLPGRCLAVAAALAACTVVASAASDTWVGTTDSTWATTTNWAGGNIPGAIGTTDNTDTVSVSNAVVTATITVDAGRNVGSIFYDQPTTNATGVTISGADLHLSSGGSIYGSRSATQTIASNLVLEGDGGSYTFNSSFGGSTNRGLLVNGTVSGVSTAGNTTTLNLTGTGGATSSYHRINGAISNGTAGGTLKVVKSDAGHWTLATANTYTGGTLVRGGTLRFLNNGAFGTGTITMEGGTVQSAGGSSSYMGLTNPVFVDAGQTGTIILSERTELDGAISGSGTLNVVAPSTISRDYWDGQTAAFAGNINISGGRRLDLRIQNGNFNGFDNAAVSIDNETVTLFTYSSNLTVRIGALSGTATATLTGSNNATNVVTYEIGARNLDSTYSGVIKNGTFTTPGTTRITKTGSGTLTLSGTNTYTGATNVNSGTLAVDGSIAASSLTTVAAGAKLAGTGRVGDTTVNGTLAPGHSIDTLIIDGDLVLAGTSDFEIDPDGVLADLADVTGTLTYGGSLNVTNIGGAFSWGDTFDLFDWGTLTPSSEFTAVNLPALDNGWVWQNNLLTDGTITVVPEPASVLGLTLLLSGALLRRRRGGNGA